MVYQIINISTRNVAGLKDNHLGARAGFPLIRLQALGAACTEPVEVAGIRFNPWREKFNTIH